MIISTKGFLVLYQVVLLMHLRHILYILIVLDITNALIFSFKTCLSGFILQNENVMFYNHLGEMQYLCTDPINDYVRMC